MPQGSKNLQWRFDTFELPPSYEHRNGSLIFTARVSRVGVLPYRLDDGRIRRELVLPETLNTPEAVASYALIPITAPHPKQPVTPQTRRRDGVGTSLQRARFANGYIEVECMVDDERGIKRIQEDGWREMSAGYRAEVIEKKDCHPIFGHYDAIQVFRDPNHLAIVPCGRAGASVALRADGGDALPSWVLDGEEEEPQTTQKFWFYHDALNEPLKPEQLEASKQEIIIMPQINLDGVQLDVQDAATAQTINTWRKDMEGKLESAEGEKAKAIEQVADMETVKKDMEGENEKLKTDMSKLQADYDALKAEHEELKNKEPQRQDGLFTEEEWEQRQKQKSALERAAKYYKIDGAEKLTTKELKREIARASVGGELRKDAADEELYIETLCEVAIDRLDARDHSYEFEDDGNTPPSQRRSQGTRNDDAGDYQNNFSNAWKKNKSA